MSLLGAAEIDRLVIDSAIHANVLPLTSQCDSRCVFCSHRNNPPDIAVAFIGRRSLAEVTRAMAFLDPAHVITIGESATPIIEGEPLTHPEFEEIIGLVRRAFPDTPVEVTTNGRLLTERRVALLAELGGISLNLSLNSGTSRGRRILMGDSPEQAARTLSGVEMLGRSTVRFSGSLVAMPNLVGWDDLRETVRFLGENGAEAVRVIVPAYAQGADRGRFPDDATIFADVRAFVAGMAAESPCPVLIEPSCVVDLAAVASGVVQGSPAWNAGLRPGDVLVEVGGERPFSRVSAWMLLQACGPARVVVARGDAHIELSWETATQGSAGVTMEYDFDAERAGNLWRIIAERRGRSLLLTSELAHPVVRAVLAALDVGDERAEAVAVKNRTFGGTIRAAGLLTVDDYLEAYERWRRPAGAEVAQMVVPLESFSPAGLDLKRRHFTHLANAAGLPIVLA